jgi:two-component system OmpR family response regulator
MSETPASIVTAPTSAQATAAQPQTTHTPTTQPHILVVEDDAFVREVLEVYLRAEGYHVTVASDGREMRNVLAEETIHLVIMDLRLPGEDGFALTRYLREQYAVGIIILTTRNETVDRVVGLECGADDYVTKPFEERELLARIRSVLRRTGALADNAAPPVRHVNGAGPQGLIFHGCTLDERAGLFRARDGAETLLTGNECRLLAYLVRTAGQVQSREKLMAAVLQRMWDPLDRSIDVLITRLRHKIEADPKRPAIIKTIRGTGYLLSLEAPSASESAA